MGIGYDNVDLDAARAAGVVVCNGPDSPTVSTAEHAVMLLLAVTKELPIQQARAAEGIGGPAVASSLELGLGLLGLVGLELVLIVFEVVLFLSVFVVRHRYRPGH